MPSGQADMVPGGAAGEPGGQDGVAASSAGAGIAPDGPDASPASAPGLAPPDRQPGAAARDQPGAVAGGQHVFDRWSWWWDLYFAVVWLTTLVVVGQTSASLTAHATASAALVAWAVMYVVLGRKVIVRRAPDWQVDLFLVGLVVLFFIADAANPASGWALFAACPQCFMAAPLRRAIAAVLVLSLTPVVLLADPARRANHGTLIVLTVAVTGAAFAIAFGTWVTRIIDQSVERAELIAKLEAAQAELAEVSREAGTLAERQRLAGEIHDTLAQGLTSIVMLLQAAEPKIAADPDEVRRHIGLATQTAREGLAEARAMVAALTPAHLESGTLPGALRRLTDRIGAELGVATRFDLCGEPRPLPAVAEVVLLRAGQEALANVRKHSRAHQVQVTLSYQDATARLEVTDDGAGFDPGQVNGGYGLRGMRGRILQAGGSFDVRTQPGAGTALVVEVPG